MAILFFFFLPLLLSSSLTLTLSQPPQKSNSTSSLDCNGVQLTYSLTKIEKIRPFLPPSSSKSQPFAFAAAATILNNGLSDLLAWSFLVSFSHQELLVSLSPGVLTSSAPFPFNTTASPSPVSFSGFPDPDLKTAIETANDLAQIQTRMLITGTLFGASDASSPPLPTHLALGDPTFICPKPDLVSASTISTCCLPNPNPPPPANATGSGGFLPRRKGDLSISYDVLQAYGSSYLAQVTIANESPRARLDNWKLSWEWMRGEFIYSIKGAYSALNGPAGCILGAQGQFYRDFDFSKVVTCDRNPTVLDLPVDRTNDTAVGRIPFCCRNGTILPAQMDPSQSKSAFQMEVFKMPPDLNRSELHPPQNWAVAGGVLNPTYRCGQPVRVAPTLYPDPSGLQSSTSAIATWQVVCNVTRPRGASPKCCVSFSAFYNDSVVPCRTCACGCPATKAGRTSSCSAAAPAMLVPAQALLVPFDNRTDLTREHARLNRLEVPDPMPCGDNCGVSINWHVNADYRRGWTARMTLFNWQDVSFADWFAGVEMDKAFDGYEAMYSFNGTRMGGRTIFMQGLPGLNYLVGEVDGANPSKDPRVPGKQQSVISFTKKTTPGIDVVAGDGFPSKIFFNGEECSMPDTIPINRGFRNAAGGNAVATLVTAAFVVILGLWL